MNIDDRPTWVALPVPLMAHWYPAGKPERAVRIHVVAPGLPGPTSNVALVELLPGTEPYRADYRVPGGGFVYALLSDLVADER